MRASGSVLSAAARVPVEASFERVLVWGSERDGDGSNDTRSDFKITDIEVLQAREHEAISLDDQARFGRKRESAESGRNVEQAVALVVDRGMAGRRGELQCDAQLGGERDRERIDPAAGAVAAPQLGRPQGGHVLEGVVVRVGARHAGKLVRVVAH